MFCLGIRERAAVGDPPLHSGRRDCRNLTHLPGQQNVGLLDPQLRLDLHGHAPPADLHPLRWIFQCLRGRGRLRCCLCDESAVWRAGVQPSRHPAFPWLRSGGRCLCAALAFQDHLHAVLSGHHPGIFLCNVALVQQGDPPREVGPVQGEDSRRNSTSRWCQTR